MEHIPNLAAAVVMAKAKIAEFNSRSAARITKLLEDGGKDRDGQVTGEEAARVAREIEFEQLRYREAAEFALELVEVYGFAAVQAETNARKLENFIEVSNSLKTRPKAARQKPAGKNTHRGRARDPHVSRLRREIRAIIKQGRTTYLEICQALDAKRLRPPDGVNWRDLTWEAAYRKHRKSVTNRIYDLKQPDQCLAISL